MTEVDEANAVIKALTWKCTGYSVYNDPLRPRATVICKSIDRGICGKALIFANECNCQCHMKASGSKPNEWEWGKWLK